MDVKRFYRDLKREVKKTGNRKLRNFLKDVSADLGEFDYGSAESSTFKKTSFFEWQNSGPSGPWMRNVTSDVIVERMPKGNEYKS